MDITESTVIRDGGGVVGILVGALVGAWVGGGVGLGIGAKVGALVFWEKTSIPPPHSQQAFHAPTGLGVQVWFISFHEHIILDLSTSSILSKFSWIWLHVILLKKSSLLWSNWEQKGFSLNILPTSQHQLLGDSQNISPEQFGFTGADVMIGKSIP